MTARAPESDVAKQLQAAGIGNLNQSGTKTLKLGPPRGVTEPGAAPVVAYVSARGGPAPQPYIAAAEFGSYFEAEIQVVVLAAADSYEAGITLARAVRDALHIKAPSATALATYVDCRAKTSEPLPLGQNAAGQWEFSINFSLTWVA